jgi:hypothetical protein
VAKLTIGQVKIRFPLKIKDFFNGIRFAVDVWHLPIILMLLFSRTFPGVCQASGGWSLIDGGPIQLITSGTEYASHF